MSGPRNEDLMSIGTETLSLRQAHFAFVATIPDGTCGGSRIYPVEMKVGSSPRQHSSFSGTLNNETPDRINIVDGAFFSPAEE